MIHLDLFVPSYFELFLLCLFFVFFSSFVFILQGLFYFPWFLFIGLKIIYFIFMLLMITLKFFDGFKIVVNYTKYKFTILTI